MTGHIEDFRHHLEKQWFGPVGVNLLHVSYEIVMNL
jgi:hypothetical protein